MNLGPLQARFYKLTGHDRGDRQVPGRIELGEPGAKPRVIAQPEQ